MAVLILAAELFNLALETLTDHLHPARRPAIGAAKDCAAGAVLLLCLGACLVGTFTLVAVIAQQH